VIADRAALAHLRHELRTPLNHIIGYSEMLLEDVEEALRVNLAPDLRRIHEEARRLLGLINDFLAPARVEAGAVDLGQMPAELFTPLEQIMARCDAFRAQAALAGAEDLLPDLERIASAAQQLLALITHGVALRPGGQPTMVTGATAAVGAPARPADQGAVLVVDDNESNREMLSRRLSRQGYRVEVAASGREALDALRAQRVDLVLLDVMMPEMDGYEVLQRLKSDPELRDIPVLMISALDEIDSVVRCIQLGAEDYLSKPFDPVLLRARVGASLERKRLYDLEENYRVLLEDRVRKQVREISWAQHGIIFAMSKLAESRDPETGAHLERIQEYCKILSKELSKLPTYASEIDKAFIENIHAASPLHDIGKVGIPDHILKKPGRLTEGELAIMKTHAVIGVETLRAVDRQNPGNKFVRIGIEIAGSHHEKWDGTGYPHGLAGEGIPLAGRIVALADVYDALTSKRCYKEALPHEESREIILAERGKRFDPDMVDCFIDAEKGFQTVRMQLADLS